MKRPSRKVFGKLPSAQRSRNTPLIELDCRIAETQIAELAVMAAKGRGMKRKRTTASMPSRMSVSLRLWSTGRHI
jgi:hypothetical protein